MYCLNVVLDPSVCFNKEKTKNNVNYVVVGCYINYRVDVVLPMMTKIQKLIPYHALLLKCTMLYRTMQIKLAHW